MLYAKKILSFFLLLNLLISSVGIDIYQHICGKTGVLIISAFYETNCSVLVDHNNHDCNYIGLKYLENNSSCCSGENNDLSHPFSTNEISEKCCVSIVEYLKLNFDANSERSTQISFKLPFKIDFNIKPIINIINPFCKLNDSFITFGIITSGAITTKYIHFITSISSSDKELPLS